MNSHINNLFKEQKDFFHTDKTKLLSFRISKLARFLNEIEKQYENIRQALKTDLNKGECETYISEYLLVVNEIKHVIKHIHHWAKPKRARSNLMNVLSTAKIIKEPLGNILIFAPWNYPLQLSLVPLVDAIAAGNTAILYLSPYVPTVNKVIKDIINNVFDIGHVQVVQVEEVKYDEIMEPKYDFIFFTGSIHVGKIIMQQAAKNLTPVCLELGGKCPCFVAKTANLKVAAQRIARGKWMNSGQTCVAPDYLLINKDVKDEFLKLLKLYITKFYGSNTLVEQNLPRIINENHFDRLTKHLKNREPYYGGKSDRQNLQIEPTVLEIKSFNDPLMQDEIFGPILPYIVCDDFSEIINDMRLLPKPLALYIFSKDKKCMANLLATVQSGDVCINDTIMHTTNHNLPFGGVGSSGMGAYHGVYGFNLFSHTKSVVKTTTKINPKFFYPPWSDKKTKLIKKIL